MTQTAPIHEWWNSTELAGSGLPDVPETRQGVDDMARRENWRAHPQFARRRAGRGGGWEYHWKLLPLRAQTALLKAAAADHKPDETAMGRGEAWAWFDGLPEKVKAEARERLKVILQVEQLAAPMGKFLAVNTVARQVQVSARTIWNWYALIEGVDPADLLPYLAPRHRAAKPKRAKAECSPSSSTC